MLCPSCGKDTGDRPELCDACRAKQAAEAELEAAPPPEESEIIEPAVEEVRPRAIIWLIILALGLLFACLGLLIFNYLRPGALRTTVIPSLAGTLPHTESAASSSSKTSENPQIEAAIKSLSAALWSNRLNGAQKLAELISADTPEALEPLQQALKDQVSPVRTAAATAIGKLGRAGAPALPDLIELEKETNLAVRVAAQRAREQIEADIAAAK